MSEHKQRKIAYFASYCQVDRKNKRLKLNNYQRVSSEDDVHTLAETPIPKSDSDYSQRTGYFNEFRIGTVTGSS